MVFIKEKALSSSLSDDPKGAVTSLLHEEKQN